jgi:UDP-N-acetylglucosamine 4-epimerase
MIKNEPVYINGDVEAGRDFCYIENAVQASLLTASVNNEDATNQVYNVAVEDQTSLNQLFKAIRKALATNDAEYQQAPVYRDFRAGDVRHSLTEIDKARQLLDYVPRHRIGEGLTEAMEWYAEELQS